jgi:DNA-directed RNA polymerase specialized sigma24 family protein
MTVAIDWKAATALNLEELSEADRQLLALLAEGRSQAEIGRNLGLHRSAVWRRATRLSKRIRHYMDKQASPK